MMKQGRRQYSRKTLNPLPHIHLPAGNGGLVLDVSEQGLGFRAIAPVEPSGPIPFSFTSNSNVVAGVGELVWFDRAKKTGGLRFTQLPYEALEQIRKWPQNANLRPDIGKDLTLHIPAPEVAPSWGANARNLRAAFTSKIASVLETIPLERYGSRVREVSLPALRGALAKLRSLLSSAGLQKQSPWLLKSAYALFLGIVVSSVIYVRHRDAGELLIRLGMKLSGEVNTLASSSVAASASPRVDDRPVYKTAYKSEADAPIAQTLPQPASVAAGKASEEFSPATPVPPAPEPAARLPKPEARGTELVVQVAAVTGEADARKLTGSLRQANFQAFVGTLPVDSLYRVMLGPYADAASARVELEKLKRAGYSSFIRRGSGAERLEGRADFDLPTTR